MRIGTSVLGRRRCRSRGAATRGLPRIDFQRGNCAWKHRLNFARTPLTSLTYLTEHANPDLTRQFAALDSGLCEHAACAWKTTDDVTGRR